MNERLFYSNDFDEAWLFDTDDNFVCMNPSPEILVRFVNDAIRNGVTRCAFKYTRYLVCILESLGYIVKIRLMTYHRTFDSLFVDRDFDIIDIMKEG